MDIEAAFDELQKSADADPDQVKEARRRRDLFKDAFAGEDDVAEEVIASGSLARSTQREPINDVDVIIVFDAELHPDWVVAKRAPRRHRLRTPAFMRERGAECRKRIPIRTDRLR